MTVTYNDGLEYQGVKVPDPPPFQYGNRTVRQFDFKTWTWSHISAGSGNDADTLGSGNTWLVKNRAAFQAQVAATATVPGSTQAYQLPNPGDHISANNGCTYVCANVGDNTNPPAGYTVYVMIQLNDVFGSLAGLPDPTPGQFYTFREYLFPDGHVEKSVNGMIVKLDKVRPFLDCLYNHPWFQATLNTTAQGINYSSTKVYPVVNASGQVVGQTVPSKTPTLITAGQLFVMAKSDKAHFWGESIPNDGGWHKVEWEINSGKACRLWIDGVGAVPSANYGMCVRDLDTQPGVRLPPGTMTYLPGQNPSVSAGINIAVSASVPSSGFIPNEYWSTPGLHSRPKEEKKPCCITSYNNGGHASLDPDKLCYECSNEGR